MRDIIDAHGHFVPAGLANAVRADPLLSEAIAIIAGPGGREMLAMPGLDQLRPMPQELDSVIQSLAWLDDRGVDRQIVGPWADLFGYLLEPDEAARWCRMMNDLQLSELEGQERLIPLAILPLQDPEAAVAEVRRAAEAGFVGVTTGCRVGGVELDDERLGIVWRALADQGMPLVMHPSFHSSETRTSDLGLPNTIGRPHDTDVAVARLLLSGTLSRYRGVKLLLMHGGGSIPLLWGRLARNHAIMSGTVDPEESREAIWVDSVVYRPESLVFLINTLGADRVLLGSDYPFPIQDPHPRHVVERAGLDAHTQERILGGNARELFHLGQ